MLDDYPTSLHWMNILCIRWQVNLLSRLIVVCVCVCALSLLLTIGNILPIYFTPSHLNDGWAILCHSIKPSIPSLLIRRCCSGSVRALPHIVVLDISPELNMWNDITPVLIEGMRICSAVGVTGVCVLLTRALYWFMVMTVGLRLGPTSPYDSLWSEHVAAPLNCVTRSLIPPSPSPTPPTACIERVAGKPARYPQRMWKPGSSAVGCSQVCQWCRPAYLSFHVGIWSYF